MVLGVIFPPTAKAASPTQSLTIKKLASDGETVLAEKTVDYRWLMDPRNMPVLGDGVTHYYHQGPVFANGPDETTEQALRWNPAEDTNVKDMGALKGTNVRDLSELVGGMAEGDKLRVKASDGLSRTFAYKNVYEYSEREGPMVICWCKDGQMPDSGFGEGMRLIWFADTSANPWQRHIFGNWDWHEAAEEEYWYYFHNGGEKYPTTTGLSIQCVAELVICSAEPAPDAPEAPVAGFAADVTSGSAPLTVKFEDRSSSGPTSWQWDFDGDGTPDSAARNPSHTYDGPGTYTVRLTVANEAGSNSEVKPDYIKVGSAAPPADPPAGTPPAEEPELPPVEPGDSPDPRPPLLKRAPLTAAAVLLVPAAGIGALLHLRLYLRKRKPRTRV
jgi:hypothetical protein